MRFVEQLVAANDAYVATRIHAARYPRITPNGPSGKKRDHYEAKANRVMRISKRAAGVR